MLCGFSKNHVSYRVRREKFYTFITMDCNESVKIFSPHPVDQVVEGRRGCKQRGSLILFALAKGLYAKSIWPNSLIVAKSREKMADCEP